MIPMGTVSQQVAQPPEQPFFFGLNTHITTQDIYRRNNATDFDSLVNFMNEIGADYNRFDLAGVDDNGVILDQGSTLHARSRLFSLDGSEIPAGEAPHNYGMVHKQAAAGRKMLPMVYDQMSDTSPLWEATEQDCYDAGFTRMAGFTTNYGQYFDVIELGNEWELFKREHLKVNFGTPEAPDYEPGTHESHWQVVNVDRAIAHIKGMHDGIKSVDPTIRTMMNCAGWAPIYWMYRIYQEVNLDIIAWHWYSDQISSIEGGGYPSSPYLSQPGSAYDNILDIISELAPGKPIWITECGTRWNMGSANAVNETRQRDYFLRYLAQFRDDPQGRCEAFFHHEGLDMANLNGGPEGFYGMIALYDYDNTQYTNWTYKQLATELRNGTISV